MRREIKQKIESLPQTCGIYLFLNQKREILYIGKAQNIKSRVRSHFQGRGNLFGKNITAQTKDIDWQKTDSEKEALILEQQLIKKYNPRFNIEWQDGKNYFFVGITPQKFPRIFITHQTKVKKLKDTPKDKPLKSGNVEYLGPYIRGTELKRFLEELRRIFPFRSCRNFPKRPCLYYDLNLCPAPCMNKISSKNYLDFIKGLKVFLEIYLGKDKRIEGYDISNISGTAMVGSMVTFEKQKRKKSDYRRFKIKRVKGQNDVGCLREVISRRLNHKEWNMPDLVLLDGGKGQLSAVREISIPGVALAKSFKHSGKIFSPFSKDFVLVDSLPDNVKNLLLRVRDEAHRFAISYHKKRREKDLLED